MRVLLLMMLEHQLEPNLKTILIKVQRTYNLVLQNIAARQGYLINFRQHSLITVQAQGAILRVLSDRDDRMVKTPPKFLGLPTKPPKNLMLYFRAIKISRGTIHGQNIQELSQILSACHHK